MLSEYLSWADFSVVGIAADIAGAVVLGLGLSVKAPERMREEVPYTVSAPTTPGHVAFPFPQAQIESMARQRAEARFGMALLVLGFGMQAAVYFFEPSSHLAGMREKVGAFVLMVFVWLCAWLGVLTYVAADAWLTLSRLPDGPGPVRLRFGGQLEMRGGRQVEVDGVSDPPRVIRLARLLGFGRKDGDSLRD